MGGGFGGWVDYKGMHPAFSGLYLQNWGYYIRRGISFLVFSLFQRGNLITQKEDFISRIRASETRYFYAMLYALLHFVLSLTYHIA